MLRRVKTLSAVLGILMATTAVAGPKHSRGYVYAKVVDVQPIVKYVTVNRPRQECWDEVVYTEPRKGVAGPALAGGIIGGAIGRQFGGGSGRDALTVAGALAGSAIAAERAARNRAGSGGARATSVERCHVVDHRYTQERVDGYRVTYKYRGRHHTMVTSEPPGSRVRLRVSAIPVGYR